jgi:hypothetical protein
MFDVLLDTLEGELRTALNAAVTGLVMMARTRLEGAVAEIEEERAKRLAEVAQERATSLEEVDARRRELQREVEAMHTHQEQQEGRVELNIGGYRFQTSVQTLRRVPHTFFDAYFSGRYAQDVCNDGSIFVDRDGEHFGHVLEYMRNGVVSVAELGARPSVSLLRALKREFGFYCIELSAEEPREPEMLETVFVLGGRNRGADALSIMERYDTSSGQWSAAPAMNTARSLFAACVLSGEIYAIGGRDDFLINDCCFSSVEKFSPSSNTWSFVTPLPFARDWHAAVSVGSAIYVLGGHDSDSAPLASVLKFDSVRGSGTWIQTTPMPEARYDHAACVVGSDVFVFGGQSNDDPDDDDHEMMRSVFKLDTLTNEWSIMAPMPLPCTSHSATVCGGLVYIVGAGSAYEVLCFDPTSGVWSALAPTLMKRAIGTSFTLGGCLYAAGGTEQQWGAERYDVVSNTWTEITDMLEGRELFGAVTISSSGPAEEQDLFDSLIAKASNEFS